METVTAKNAVKIWRAPDVMDAMMMKGRYVGHRYPPHAHDTHCVAVMTSGSLLVETRNERKVCKRGDVIVIEADTIHSGMAANDGQWKMRVFHVDPTALSSYCERLGLRGTSDFHLRSAFISDVELAEQLYGINWCSEVADDSFKRSETLASAIISLRSRYMLEAGDLPTPRREPELVRSVKHQLTEDLTSKTTLIELAAEHRVTPFVLLRAFLREAGISPHAFQQQQRIRKAMTLLQCGKTIADVASRTGFADQPHLTRVFRQQTGVTPKLYQQAFLREPR